MGLLTEGIPLSWSETKKHADYVKREGVKQFIRLYHKLANSTGAALFWGDEIEYTLVRIDPITKETTLLLMAAELLPYLQWEEKNMPVGSDVDMLWRPEYAGYMIEGTPGKPFGHLPEYLNTVEYSMQRRRDLVQKRLPDNCYIMCLTTFPRLGCPDFTYPPTKPTPKEGVSCSLFYPDGAIFGAHPRYKTLTRNIRERRGSKVAVNLPIFHDVQTPKPFIEDFSAYHDGSDPSATKDALPDHVYVDAMGFGMGCSCLQVTFQGCCISEARMLYDQLTTICPIVMALSAATPAIRGYLLDVDCRWGIISGAVDDRTEEERGLKPLEKDRFRIAKSRYDSVSSYLSPDGDAYNDTELPFDKEIFNQLCNEGIDAILAKHVAHLFIRDPISLFAEKLVPESEDETDHFENIQSTNWQSMRFKPPPANSDIGWRVEFRPMELQLTNFENAAFATFVVLLTRTILSLKLNFLIPISKVEENMRNAVKRDAVNQGRFYFRRGDLITTGASPRDAAAACREMRFSRTRTAPRVNGDVALHCESESQCAESRVLFCLETSIPTELHCKEIHSSSEISSETRPLKNGTCNIKPTECCTIMSVNEIINGSTWNRGQGVVFDLCTSILCSPGTEQFLRQESFPGLIPLIRHYMSMTEVDPNTAFSVYQYLKLIERRASGELPTTAAWMRDRVMQHPEYKHDSVVSARVTSDLMADCLAASSGQLRPDLLLQGMALSRTMAHPPAATLSAEASLNAKRFQSLTSLSNLEEVNEPYRDLLFKGAKPGNPNRLNLLEHYCML